MPDNIKYNFLQIEKFNDSKKVIIMSPFYPFNQDLIKKFFSEMNLGNYELHFSFLKTDKIKDDNNILPDYQNLYDHYAEYIRKINKKITLIAFGIFTNLFIDLSIQFEDKIEYIYFIEPDFSDIFLKNIFDFKRKFFLNSTIRNFYFENNKIKNDNSIFSFVDIKFLKKYYQTGKEHRFKNLLESIPEELDLTIYKNVIKNKLSLKDNSFFCKYYNEKDKKLILNKETPRNVKIKLKNILINFNILPKIIIIWNIMSRESWPLPQALEEYKIPLYNLTTDFYTSITSNKNQLEKILKNYLPLN